MHVRSLEWHRQNLCEDLFVKKLLIDVISNTNVMLIATHPPGGTERPWGWGVFLMKSS